MTAEHTDPAARFPSDFAWGAATSSYQIEGSPGEGGRGRSIWDAFTAEPGRVVDASTGEAAARSYRRPEADLDLVDRLGLTAYRFSISWPRVCPEGSGRVNPEGLAYYDRLVDGLLERGVDPWVTLYHWDLPQALEESGGWPERDTAKRFAEYAAVAADALGDRVTRWMTVNEPWCAAFLGYASGEHAPGRREPAAALAAGHHLMLAHGLAARAIKDAAPAAKTGLGPNFYPVRPATESPEDRDAARRIDGLQNRLFADAAIKGSYPDDVVADLVSVTDFSFVADGDMRTVQAPLDFLGVNYYSSFTVSGRAGAPSASAAPTDTASAWPGSEHVGFVRTGRPTTAMDWEIDPEGLTGILTLLRDRYPGTDLVVTENGAAFDDVPGADGRVADRERRRYIADHVDACAAAIAEGVRLRGYFVWSLMDNFEWAWGYTKRFGIAYTDFASGARTLKASGEWYAALVRSARGDE
ncbi:GH1 family beta-glucosidase [Salininema proteolyticum]|uniref:Beta-glucosidase n=1 Tax=Salininema proteolyticum TaxID=1607685 RepID=A0ABV8TUN4_9ACTN